jgi:hypothetical protein
MTAPSWARVHQQARDDAWRAFDRLGVESFDVSEMTAEIGRAIVPATLDVAADLGQTLDDEARVRVLSAAVRAAVNAAASGIVDAVANEVARPDPVPFSPPAAGSWVRSRVMRSGGRSRRARRPDTGPTWDGAWHVFSGDFEPGDRRRHEVTGRSACGQRLTLRSANLFDAAAGTSYATADETPGVDACRTCRRVTSGGRGKTT